MASAFELLDKALVLGRQELEHLAAGEVEQAGELAEGRDGMLSEILSEKVLAEPAAADLDGILSRLLELKDLQARIIDEAQRLRSEVAAKLRRNGLEQRRHAGYGRATHPTPRVQSRYISRNG